MRLWPLARLCREAFPGGPSRLGPALLFMMATLLLGGCEAGGRAEPASGAQVATDPFQLCLGDTLCLLPADPLALPQPWTHAEGPRPQLNPQTALQFPPLGWVVGQTDNRTIPAFIWQGNRLSGVDSGTLYQVTAVQSRQATPAGEDIALATNYGSEPAMLRLRRHPSGAQLATLEPPPGMAEEGIALTLFSAATPAGEGLFGMGARKDYFNQRGLLRNVWTEQQNTGLGAIDEIEGGGAGLPLALPTPGLLDQLGLETDVDDLLLAEDRTSFPNGAQAAYWVEAYVVGSRGWALWTDNMHFQRLDLAATRGDALRWQVVDADVVTLAYAEGGIEAASRTYTEYWGRAPKPGIAAWEPWIDTLNQGEGEAAPNGQGFWGGQRARCEIEQFIARSAPEAYDIPFELIGVEGWQVIPPAHPACLALSTAEICAHESGFPVDEAGWRAEVEAGTSFFNTVAGCARAGDSFLDYVREQGYELTGYWNFFTTQHPCPGDTAAGCEDDQLGVPLASKQAWYAAREAGVFVTDAGSDTPHEVTTNRGGVSNIIDFTNPAAADYWYAQLARMFDLGIDIFMHDFGELTTEAMGFAQGENITEQHNLYAWRYQQAMAQALARYKREGARRADFAPYAFARAGMTGACAHTPGVFPGDESPTWDAGHGLPSVVPAMLNLALSGCYAFSTDVGGYFDFVAPRTTEDLFIRWSQLAALTPVMRLHNSTFNGSVFPWTWAEGEHADAPAYDTPGIFRRYARLKRNLIPLVEHWARRAAQQGVIGPVRPLILEDTSPEAMAVDYQWLLGDDLLVAPVVEEDASSQSVYLPAGSDWLQVTVTEAGELLPAPVALPGGVTLLLGLEPDLRDIPLFLRCGGRHEFLPLAAPGDCGEVALVDQFIAQNPSR